MMLQRSIIRQRSALSTVLLPRATPASIVASRQLSRSQSIVSPFRRSPFRIAYRPYSTEPSTNTNEIKKDENQTNGEDNGTPASAEESLKKELEAKNKEVIDLKDKYLRSVAEFRNLQERTKRDIEQARNFAIQRFAADLLESIDNLDRALMAVPADKLSPATAETNKELHDLFQGLKMTETILMATLKKHGLERFDPAEPTEDGKPPKFDPKLHEATFMAKAEDKEDGDIMHVQSKGFLLNGRVVRAAKVGVVKNT